MVSKIRRAVLTGSALLVLIWTGTASAQLDVESIAFYRNVDRVDAGAESESAGFEVVVRGSGITSVTLTKPDDDDDTLSEGPTGTWSAIFGFADANSLDAAYPGDGDTYTVDLNGGERVIELEYDIPTLPDDFAISSPVHDSDNNSPTTTPFTFSSCDADDCSNDDDHVFVLIEEGSDTIASGIVVDPDSGEWTPVDPNDDPIVLPENADMDFTAELTAWRTSFGIADVTDPYTFFNVFFLSDRVSFSTGFRGLDEAPVGPFSISSADASEGILITDGPLTASIGGVDLDFDYTMDPKGKIDGSGNADVDGNGSYETPIDVIGKISGKDASPTQKIKIKIKNKEPGTEAKATYKRNEEFDLEAETVSREESLKGKVLGVKVKETLESSASIAGTATDWQLDFTLSTDDGRAMIVSNASLTVAAGTPIPLEGSGTYNSVKQSTQITLKSTGDDKGIRAQIKGFEVDSMNAISGGTLKLKAYGQSVTADLAPVP